eukprot:scaffold5930_cov64-Phaeocystis_antarctica.AAC.4
MPAGLLTTARCSSSYATVKAPHWHRPSVNLICRSMSTTATESSALGSSSTTSPGFTWRFMSAGSPSTSKRPLLAARIPCVVLPRSSKASPTNFVIRRDGSLSRMQVSWTVTICGCRSLAAKAAPCHDAKRAAISLGTGGSVVISSPALQRTATTRARHGGGRADPSRRPPTAAREATSWTTFIAVREAGQELDDRLRRRTPPRARAARTCKGC